MRNIIFGEEINSHLLAVAIGEQCVRWVVKDAWGGAEGHQIQMTALNEAEYILSTLESA